MIELQAQASQCAVSSSQKAKMPSFTSSARLKKRIRHEPNHCARRKTFSIRGRMARGSGMIRSKGTAAATSTAVHHAVRPRLGTCACGPDGRRALARLTTASIAKTSVTATSRPRPVHTPDSGNASCSGTSTDAATVVAATSAWNASMAWCLGDACSMCVR